MRVAGLILAGGRSTRMDGRDKALAELRGCPLLAFVLERLAPQVETVALNTNADPASFQAFDLPILPDTLPGYAGPLAGVLAGLEWAASRFDAILTAAVDTPFFPIDLASRLSGEGGPAVAASGGRRHPVFALWPETLKEPLGHFLTSAGTGRVATFQDQVGFISVEFPFLETSTGAVDPFFNLNTPGDLARAQEIAAVLP